MTSFTLNYVGGGQCSEFWAANDREAAEVAACMVVSAGCCRGDLNGYETEPVIADQWDSAGANDDGAPCKRLLIWASASDAANDDGSKAVAQIETIGAV